MMTDGNHYYKDDELAGQQWLEENYAEQISTDWQKNEFLTFQDMIDSGKDGFVEVYPGRETDANYGNIHHNLGPESPPHFWLTNVNRYPALKIIQVNNALIVPSDDRIYNGKRCFVSEVRDAHGRLIPESMARMMELTITPEKVDELCQSATMRKGTYIYGGKFWSHYGHFTIETLSTLWPYREFKLDPSIIKPIYSVENTRTGIKRAYVTEALNRYGIEREDVMFAIEPVIVERMLIPVPSARIHTGNDNYIHPAQKGVWSSIAKEHPGEPNKKIYLSRRFYRENNLEKRPLSNEEHIEKLFLSHGFEIVYPEKLQFREQLELFNQARVIAGPVGSNLLNSAYARDHISLVAICPHSIKDRTQIMLSDIKHIVNYFYFSSDENIRHDSQESWSIDLGDFENFLKNNGIFN